MDLRKLLLHYVLLFPLVIMIGQQCYMMEMIIIFLNHIIFTEKEQDTYVTFGNSGTLKKERIYNQAYMYSPKARAAPAQIIIDGLSGFPAIGHPNVHAVVCHALEIGATPEEIDIIGRNSRTATDFITTFMTKEKWNA